MWAQFQFQKRECRSVRSLLSKTLALGAAAPEVGGTPSASLQSSCLHFINHFSLAARGRTAALIPTIQIAARFVCLRKTMPSSSSLCLHSSDFFCCFIFHLYPPKGAAAGGDEVT